MKIKSLYNYINLDNTQSGPDRATRLGPGRASQPMTKLISVTNPDGARILLIKIIQDPVQSSRFLHGCLSFWFLKVTYSLKLR